MYDDFEFQQTYPIIQWHNGNRASKTTGGLAYTGGWLLPADKLPSDAHVNGVWQGPQSWSFESGQAEQVYATGEIFVALLRRRRRWFELIEATTVYYTDEQARGRRGPSASLRAGLRSHLQVLVAALGVSVPLVLSVKGSRSCALDKALSTFYHKVIVPANRAAGKAQPLYHFWAKLGSSVAVCGDEGFVTVGSGKTSKTVALPVAILPEVVDADYLPKAAVPDELRAQCAQWRDEADVWASAWQRDPGDGNGNAPVVDLDTGEIVDE